MSPTKVRHSCKSSPNSPVRIALPSRVHRVTLKRQNCVAALGYVTFSTKRSDEHWTQFIRWLDWLKWTFWRPFGMPPVPDRLYSFPKCRSNCWWNGKYVVWRSRHCGALNWFTKKCNGSSSIVALRFNKKCYGECATIFLCSSTSSLWYASFAAFQNCTKRSSMLLRLCCAVVYQIQTQWSRTLWPSN